MSGKSCIFSLKCWAMLQWTQVSRYLYFCSLLCSHSTFFASITRLIHQSFLLYKSLGITIDDKTLLYSCFTGTLALKLLERVCTKTHNFYILLPSDPPHCGLMLSSKQEWISTAVAAVAVPSHPTFFLPRMIMVKIFSFFWKATKNMPFAYYGPWKNVIELKPYMKSLNLKNWGGFPFDIASLMKCLKNFVCLRGSKSDWKSENIFIGITWHSYIQNLYHSRLKYFINMSLTCKVHILQFVISHGHRGILANFSSKCTICWFFFLFACLTQCIFHV